MDKVIVVHFLGVDDVTILFLAQVRWVDAIGSQEFSIGHTKRLTNGLRNQLCLWEGECLGKTTQQKGQQQGGEKDHRDLSDHN